MKKFNLKRTRPERSQKRRLASEGKKLISLRPRVTPEIKAAITREAADLGITESLYLNAIIETRSLSKIKKILDGE